jgi:hypothetical protein
MQGYVAKSNDLNTAGPTSATASTALAPAQYLGPARTRQSWNNKRQALFARAVSSSVAKQAAISTNLQALPAPVVTTFTGLATANGNLGAQLAMVSRLLLSRANMGHRRDTFFVSISGWDDHDGLASNYGPRLAQLDAALGAFWTALGQLGLQENVTLYTQSDFGRALKQNNDGSDHGWGGHALIMGGAVQGGQLFGTPPDFATGSVNDADQGRLIPTTSADQYVATMLKWWGVPESQMEKVLPNLANFSIKTLPIMREPLPAVSQPKAYSLDLASLLAAGQPLPADVSYSRAVNSVATQFDRDGKMISSPVNAIPNSEFFGGEAYIGRRGVNNAEWSMPSSMFWNVNPGATGLAITLNDIGIENGMRYTEWNVQGTTTATSYPMIGVTPWSGSAGAMLAANGESFTFFVKLRRIKEKSPNPYPWVTNMIGSTSAQGGVAGHDLSSTLTFSEAVSNATDEPFQMFRTYSVNNATAARVQARVLMTGVPTGTIINDTIRIYEPMVIPGIWDRENPPKYLPTTNGARALPRLDYEPASGRIRGVMREATRINWIRNSLGIGAAAGVPGTAPTNWSRNTPAGIAVTVGQRKYVNGMPVIPFRIFGRSVAGGTGNIPFDSSTQAAVVTNDDWVGSFYARLAAGSLANVTTINAELIEYNAGAYLNASGRSMAAINGNKISSQRWFNGKQLTDPLCSSVMLQFRYTVAANQNVDFTIEIACPQLEKTRQASSWIPTGTGTNQSSGATAQRNSEVFEVVSGFSGWYNPTQGTLIVKGEAQVGLGGSRSTWPRLAGFSILTGTDSSSAQNTFGIYHLTSPDPAFNGRSGSSVLNANVTSGDNGITTPVVADGKPATRAMSYSAGFLQTSHRGVNTVAAVPTGFPAVTRLQIGMGNFDAPVWIQSIDYYATKLTPTEMAVITSG